VNQDVPSRNRLGLPDWDRLIPDLKGYFNPGPTAPEYWAFETANLECAIGLSELFWPPFIEYNNMVFRGDAPVGPDGARNIASWMKSLKGEQAKVEQMLNHTHLVDLFADASREGSPDKIMYLARVVREMWDAKLRLDFPNKSFVVDLYVPPTDDISEWQITFYQLGDNAAAAPPRLHQRHDRHAE
jgi:hypothetical protein